MKKVFDTHYYSVVNGSNDESQNDDKEIGFNAEISIRESRSKGQGTRVPQFFFRLHREANHGRFKRGEGVKAGEKFSKEYQTWRAMLSRCKSDPRYAGRGVKVCKRWQDSYDAFLKDVGRAPTKNHSIDRLNPLGDYAPANCRWATRNEQAKTRTNNRHLTIHGRTMILEDWARESGLSHCVIAHRIAAGWTPEDAIRVKHKSTRGKRAGAVCTGTIVKVTSLSAPPDLIAWAKEFSRSRGQAVSKFICTLLQAEREKLSRP